ncbi:hypothetical protein HELRODRAFT_62048, partial [Helobdella robusta]|uniref:Uncharacterized protein n=1 Tax=Helobdella robusta TaxID=6412 RepID=T1FWU6_HELRO
MLLSSTIIKRIKEENIKDALFIAAKKGHLETIIEILTVDRSLVEATDDSANTPVLIAADNDRVDAVRLLIEQYSADITVKNNKLQTIYDLAMRQSTSEVLQLLMQHDKSDMIVENQDGEIPLQSAVKYGTISEVQALINTFYKSKKVNIDLKDELGQSALFMSAEKGNAEIFELLILNGANMTLRNN